MKSKVQPNKVGTYNSQPYTCPLQEEVPDKAGRKRVERYLKMKGTELSGPRTLVLQALKMAPRHIREAALGLDG